MNCAAQVSVLALQTEKIAIGTTILAMGFHSKNSLRNSNNYKSFTVRHILDAA